MPAAKKAHPEYQYLNILKDVLKNGCEKPVWGTDQTVTSVFGRQMRFDLSQGFPLLTTKKVFLRGIIHELLWFLSGSSNIKYLVNNNIHIWDEWAYKIYRDYMEADLVEKMTQEEFIEKIKNDRQFALEAKKPPFKNKKYGTIDGKGWGDLGLVYGAQWRRWPTKDGRTIDQVAWALQTLKKTPYRKHMVISAWNPEYTYEMARPGESMVIAPCHSLYQLIVNDNKLSLQLYQRSCDLFLGIPFNIASYALLTLMFAHVLGYKPGEFIHTLGDTHIYSNHFEAVKEQLARTPRPFPKMKLNPEIKNIDDFRYEDFTLKDYNPYPPIKAEITVVGGF